MSGRVCDQDRKGEVEGFGRAEQMGELGGEQKEEDDGTEQLPKREESRIGKVQRGVWVVGEGLSWAESSHQQTFQQWMIVSTQCSPNL